ncbi:MAG: tRNA (uridine(34)/cytosine(34)/5-carboxymethylaminomethyluridine(34)-2'-O)-methyltransferase TrmL [Pirellulaceae bacterium]
MSGFPRLNIVLYQPEIPQNTGNISRTCVAINARLWLIRPLGFDLSEKRVRRAGLDYWPHLDLRVCDNWTHFLQQANPTRCWFLTKKASHNVYDVQFDPNDFLVFGSETRGLPDDILETHAANTLRIPTTENVRSLNLSNAVAIVAYEAVRQLS